MRRIFCWFLSVVFIPINITQADPLPPYVSYYFGPIASKGSVHTYKAWGVRYVNRSARPIEWAVTYANEGYFPDHYRDGISLQFVWPIKVFESSHFSFSAAAGPYLYFDTVFSPGIATYLNQHGAGIKFDITTLYDYSPFVLALGVSHIYTFDSFNTTALTFGVGLQLDPSPPSSLVPHKKNNELIFATGRALVNAGFGQTQRALPFNIDYRYHFNFPMDVSVSFLREGKTTLSTREGFATQIWGRAYFFNDNKLSLSLGIGPYLAHEKEPVQNQRTVMNGLISMSASYLLYKPLGLVGRFTWHRVMTDYNRDSDLFLIGFGILF